MQRLILAVFALLAMAASALAYAPDHDLDGDGCLNFREIVYSVQNDEHIDDEETAECVVTVALVQLGKTEICLSKRRLAGAAQDRAGTAVSAGTEFARPTPRRSSLPRRRARDHQEPQQGRRRHARRRRRVRRDPHRVMQPCVMRDVRRCGARRCAPAPRVIIA